MSCKCTHCKNYPLYKWATIMECACECHTDKDITGHDRLCCEFPNGKKKDNPHKNLKSVEYYKGILNEWNKEADVELIK